eukprot:Tamp_32775.p3 GENE.Tamp_32775~~Tamp_32775.p3  ORF type:complete len:117 (+),score=46.12 Tamp_32775:2-352(+)
MQVRDLSTHEEDGRAARAISPAPVDDSANRSWTERMLAKLEHIASVDSQTLLEFRRRREEQAAEMEMARQLSALMHAQKNQGQNYEALREEIQLGLEDEEEEKKEEEEVEEEEVAL